ncbi:MAG: DNA/RNA non-specific endonuclease [Verrucomicrobiota bacterium]
MARKSPLRSVLADKAVMDEIRGNTGERLEAVRDTPGNEAVDVLLSGDESGVTGGEYTLSEAIILLRGRPALVVQDGVWEDPQSEEIRKRLAPAEAALKAIIPNVGRVEILDYQSEYVGTGWMIDEDLLITNRHVGEHFGEKRGDAFSFRANPEGTLFKARVDFRREYQRTGISQAAIEEIIYIEERSELRPDFALVRLNKSNGLPKPIELDSAQVQFQSDIAIIGYPAEDSRNDAFAMRDIFKGIYNVKRLSPGRVSGARADGKLLEHDCTTLGGNSGSVVINLATGKACGLHFSGSYRDRNYAVTAAWLKARIQEVAPTQVRVRGRAPTEGGNVPPSVEEAVPDLSTGRAGYQPDFLGADGLSVPLPEISASLAAQIAPVNGRTDGLLTYSHFSIRMRADRRLPFFTAVNIDGNKLFNFTRGTDRWYKDARLTNQDHQIGGELYQGNSLDRGHLVRRLDPTWGDTRDEAKQAEQETFFFTNCSPQHSQLNQRTWLSLEDYVLSNAGTFGLKVTVFSGPVMKDGDDEYRGVKLPREFWKVAVVVNPLSGELSATGYMLSQKDLIGNLEFVYGQFRTYQVPISQIEEETGLSFNLSSADPLARTEAKPQRIIESRTDIIL